MQKKSALSIFQEENLERAKANTNLPFRIELKPLLSKKKWKYAILPIYKSGATDGKRATECSQKWRDWFIWNRTSRERMYNLTRKLTTEQSYQVSSLNM